jgi:tRNA modification GTPase
MILGRDEETIVALSTPRGSGAIGLVRLSGSNAIEVTSSISLLSSEKPLKDQKTHTIHHGHIVDDNESKTVIDEVLFFLMRAPRTFTGEDTVEISCHNNPFIIEKIIQRAIAAGARHAKQGEFTRRAFLNNKVDLLQAEAINDLISAQTEYALNKSMAQLQGSLSSYVAEVERKSVELLTIVEASFDFLDEEQRDFNPDSLIREKLSDFLEYISNVKEKFTQQQQIKDGIRIALLGSVNVGKSKLFNALLKKDRAIVTNVAGTTRDTIEAGLYRDGNFWSLIDTAGLRQTGDFIEQKGIERSREEAKKADVVLLVYDAVVMNDKEQLRLYRELHEAHRKKVIVVLNKQDLLDSKMKKNVLDVIGAEAILVSAQNNENIDALESCIRKKIETLFAQCQSPFLLNQRQYHILTEVESILRSLVNEASDYVHYEIIAQHLRELLGHVSELTGKGVSEQIIDSVFDTFCLGK